jgi:hypothetical protein
MNLLDKLSESLVNYFETLFNRDNICYFLDWYDWMEQYKIYSLSVLPASFGPQDAFKIVSLCPSVQLALKVTFLIACKLIDCTFDLLIHTTICFVFLAV